MYASRFSALAAAAAICLFSVPAEAGLWKGWASSYPEDLKPLTVLPQAVPEPTNPGFRPLVVLRLPVSVRKEDLDAARENYRWKSGKGDNLADIYKEKEMDKTVLDLMFVKTAHHGAELYSCLSRHTAEVSDLVLEPYEIMQENGVWKRSGAEVAHPASVVLDFHARTEGYAMATISLTFGPRYLPLFNVRMSPAALPAVKGAVAGPIPQNPLMQQRLGYADFDARAGHGIDFVDFLNRAPLKGTSFAGWAKEPPAGVPKELVKEKGPHQTGTYLAMPIVSQGLELNDKGVATIRDREDCAVLANLVRSSVAHLNTQRTAEEQRFAAFVKHFDQPLSQQISSGGALDSAAQERADLLKSFYAAEIDFLSQQDARMYQEIMEGPWSEAFYAARAEEAKSYTKRKVGIGAMLLVAGAGVAASAAGAAGTSLASMAFNESTESTLANEMMQLRSPQVHLGDFVVEISSAGQKITAKNSVELRAALAQMYQNKYPTVAQPATAASAN